MEKRTLNCKIDWLIVCFLKSKTFFIAWEWDAILPYKQIPYQSRVVLSYMVGSIYYLEAWTVTLAFYDGTNL